MCAWHPGILPCLGACLPVLLVYNDVGRWEEKGSQGSELRVEFNGALWLVGLRHSLMLVWNNTGLIVLCAYILGLVLDGKGS